MGKTEHRLGTLLSWNVQGLSCLPAFPTGPSAHAGAPLQTNEQKRKQINKQNTINETTTITHTNIKLDINNLHETMPHATAS